MDWNRPATELHDQIRGLQPWPLASVVLKQGTATTVEDLRTYLEGRVAHWQVPERWAVIDEVPKTSVGKFDKKVLRRRYADGELEVSTLA